MYYFRQLCNNDAFLKVKSQPMEELGEWHRDVTNSSDKVTSVATERNQPWALWPSIALVGSILCWLSVFLYVIFYLCSLCQVLSATAVSSGSPGTGRAK